MRNFRLMVAAAIAVCIAGCAVGPNYHTPATTMPANFAAAQVAPHTVDISQWWRSFGDPQLDKLVDRAIANNFDLQIALARLQEARVAEIVTEGDALPSLEFSGGAGRGSGTNSTKGRVSAPLNAATNTTGLKEITQVVGFDAGWELDIFGRYRRLIEAAQYNTQAAADARNAVLITLVSDVARAYMEIESTQLRLKIAVDNIQIERTTVDVVQQRYNLGFTNELDLALARRQLATLQSEIAPLNAEIVAARRRLAVLLGEFPDDLASEIAVPADMPRLPMKIASGLPVDLLRRRPDIQEAERQLAASNALVGAAIANLFPRIAVTAGAGLQGQGLGRTPARNSFIWSVGPEAYWPLLDFGALDAQIDIQNYQTQEALINYRKLIVSAVEEVEDAFSAYSAEEDRLQNLADALTASQRAVTLANQRYRRGLTGFLYVTDAERQLYEIQDAYAVAQDDAVVQYIAIYKALGGGWEPYQQIPPVRAPQPALIATVREVIAPDKPPK